MKLLACSLAFLLFTASPLPAQMTPVRPGVRQADQAEVQAEKNIPPPMTRQTRLDLVKLRQDADEMARISQTIQSDVAVIEKGLLPKDMIEELKRIEKLSKHLRSQISQ